MFVVWKQLYMHVTYRSTPVPQALIEQHVRNYYQTSLHKVTLCVMLDFCVTQCVSIVALHMLQDPTRSKTATVLAARKLQSHLPRTAYIKQNMVIQTSQAETGAAIPGENPLVDLMQQCGS